MNELKILTKHISCKCKYKLDGRKCDSYKKRNNYKYQSKWKKYHIYVKTIIYGTLRYVVVRDGKYLTSIIDDSVITSDETMKERKTIPTNLM